MFLVKNFFLCALSVSAVDHPPVLKIIKAIYSATVMPV
jgi:hypothetical protein